MQSNSNIRPARSQPPRPPRHAQGPPSPETPQEAGEIGSVFTRRIGQSLTDNLNRKRAGGAGLTPPPPAEGTGGEGGGTIPNAQEQVLARIVTAEPAKKPFSLSKLYNRPGRRSAPLKAAYEAAGRARSRSR